MLLAEVVATSEAIGATRARKEKTAALADLLRAATPDEIEPVVGFLVGAARQGRIGVGWATVAGVDSAPAAEPSITVGDLDRAIDALAGATGAGSVAGRRAVLDDLLTRATAPEQDFVRRLMVGEVRHGALEGLVADAAARAADVPLAPFRRALMLDGDLGRVARLARTGGRAGLDAVRLEPMRPVLPMLAASAPDTGAALERTGEASVEWKLDGARIQVHRVGDDVRIFTRNRNDVTHRLDVVVAAVRAFPAHTLVLDGEAVGLAADDRPRPFQETMRTFGADTEREHTLVALFFDCLHRDGADLLDEPLEVRRAALEAVAGDACVPRVVTDDADTAAAFLAAALDTGHEGVLVKAVGSSYEAGRRGASWIKVKPVRTLDLVVLAAEWGHGRRRGWLSNLHLGARDPRRDGDGFVMVGKTFKGLTDELLTWQTEQLRALADDTSGHVVPVRPQLVVEIALDGVQRSTRYPGGVALRFARVRRYRDDKTPADADTIDAVRALLAE